MELLEKLHERKQTKEMLRLTLRWGARRCPQTP